MEAIADILKNMKNPSMRNGLMASYKKLEERKREARANLSDNARYLNINLEDIGEVNDSEAMSIQSAAESKKAHDEACKHCDFTAYDCDKCEYNSSDYYFFKSVNKYARQAISGCRKYKAWKEQKKIKRIMGDSGLGSRFLSRTFETFKPTAATKAAYDMCLAFCDTFGEKSRGLMLMGNCGCGKTHLAAAIISMLAHKGVPGFFVVVPELMAKLREGIGTHDGKAEEIIATAKNSELLVLDDLGAEKESEWVKEQLYMLINYRYEHELPTIITTNYDGEELENELGRRTMSRLVEMTRPIIIKAKDFRMRG